MDAREVKVIDTSGRNGQPGQDNWTKKPAEGNILDNLLNHS
jgi:hypothetical protein